MPTPNDPCDHYFMMPDSVVHERLPASRLGVLCYLYRRANKQGECWPSIRRMAGELAIGAGTVQRILDELVDRGLVYCTPGRPGPSGKGASNRYRVARLARAHDGHRACSPQAQGVPTTDTGCTHGAHTRKTQEGIHTKENTEREKPTLAQVEAYASKLSEKTEAVGFFDYYSATGWKTASGNPIADWCAQFRRWIRRRNERAAQYGPAKYERRVVLPDYENDRGLGE